MRVCVFAALLALAGSSVAAAQATDSLSASRRVVAAAALAAKEYGLGVDVAGGRVNLPEEVEEAKLFLDQARFDVATLPAAVRVHADSELATLRAMVERLAPPGDVERRAVALVRRIGEAAGQPLDPPPSAPPSLARGARLYRQHCAACHGDAGLGDGPKARTLKGPPPASLADSGVAATPPVEVFRKVAIGVPGTAMPEFEATLSADERWDVTAFVLTLGATGDGGRGTGGPIARPPSLLPAVFAIVRRQVDSAVALRSDRLAFDAYLSFERVETEVRVRHPALAAELEADFAALRTRAGTATPVTLDAIRRRLLEGLERAERLVSDRPSTASLFTQSLGILVREGFEAILIIGALLAFLRRANAPEGQRSVVWGAWSAVAASAATWILIDRLLEISPGQREALEGVTMLLAAAVLFYVSYWLLSKIEAERWNAFVRRRMERAVSAGSGLALGSVAFLAVYREGFETILFYQALLASAGRGGTGAGVGVWAVVGGVVVGSIALAGLYLAIGRLGLRIPLKPFFAATSALLYYTSFVFAGKGVAELQEAGVVGTTVLPWAPRIPVLGIYPTAESLALQAVLVGLVVIALTVLKGHSRSPTTEGESP